MRPIQFPGFFVRLLPAALEAALRGLGLRVQARVFNGRAAW
jgi:hypothetical protein